ncbi:MAG: radical SAM protein [Lachnospiraceae bacterium]|nr:radical SAM protein [Lachnospiraceae bacterium]
MGELDFKQKLLTTNYKEWIANFSHGNMCIPQIIELDPTSNCNYSCNCCINSDIINKNGFISKNILLKFIDDFAEMGGMGIIFIGGGEPLMYPDFGEILKYVYNKGIKFGITTNGFFIDQYLYEIANYSSWTRISVDAASKKMYDIVRPCKYEKSYERVLKNIDRLSKDKTGVLGFSYLLLEDKGFTNVDEIVKAAKLARDLGCDYFELKPMVDENHFLYRYSKGLLEKLHEKVFQLNDLKSESFNIIYANSIDQYSESKLTQPKSYDYCPSAYLRNVVTNYGVFPCPYKRGNQKFNMGSINTGLKEFMYSKDREHILETLDPKVDCKHFCIRNEVNEFLQAIKEGNISVSDCNFVSSEDVFV